MKNSGERHMQYKSELRESSGKVYYGMNEWMIMKGLQIEEGIINWCTVWCMQEKTSTYDHH